MESIYPGERKRERKKESVWFWYQQFVICMLGRDIKSTEETEKEFKRCNKNKNEIEWMNRRWKEKLRAVQDENMKWNPEDEQKSLESRKQEWKKRKRKKTHRKKRKIKGKERKAFIRFKKIIRLNCFRKKKIFKKVSLS